MQVNTSGPHRKSTDIDQLATAMDYSYFATVPSQHHQFMGLAPTPAHIIPVNSHEFSNGSPPDPYDFQSFDAFNQFNSIPEPATPQSLQKAIAPLPNDATDANSEMNGDQNRQGSNSENEEDMTPAQARRKAQNRAAQRAFRERKERHVKELEAQVAALKQSVGSVSAENERLKLNLQKVSVENEILRATSQAHPSRSSSRGLPDAGPMHYNPKDFYNEVLDGHSNKTLSHRISTDPVTGSKLLAAAASWDYIIAHPLFEKGLVDVANVAEMLKSKAKCDGQGPVFEERVILEAIENSVASGSDELI